MPRYVSKGGMFKCHAYRYLNNDDCEVNRLAKTNPDTVKFVGKSVDLQSIFVDVNDGDDVVEVPLDYYLVIYDDGVISVMSPEMFDAHYELDNPYLKGQ